jgi:hypothetical protein
MPQRRDDIDDRQLRIVLQRQRDGSGHGRVERLATDNDQDSRETIH